MIYVYYFIRGRNTTTIIPCLTSVWYQAYTILLFVLAVGVIALACVETRWSVCGYYTTWPGLYDPCNVMPTTSDTTDGFFGIAVTGNASFAYGDVRQPQGSMSVMTFDGYCVASNGSADIFGIQSRNYTNTSWISAEWGT